MSVYLIICRNTKEQTLVQIYETLIEPLNDKSNSKDITKKAIKNDILELNPYSFLVVGNFDLNYLKTKLDSIFDCDAIVLQLDNMDVLEEDKIVGIQGNGTLIHWSTLIPCLRANIS